MRGLLGSTIQGIVCFGSFIGAVDCQPKFVPQCRSTLSEMEPEALGYFVFLLKLNLSLIWYLV